jgi:hypothetical protein
MPHSWRDTARPIIAKVLQDCRDTGATEKQIRAALFAAYPFGERRYFPYKVWCDEVRAQRGLKAKANAAKSEKNGQQRLAEWQELYGRKEA